MLSSISRLSSAFASIYMKYLTWMFLRKLPLGYRFLPKIQAALAVFLLSFALQPKLKTRRRSIPILLGVATNDTITNLITVALNLGSLLCCMDFIYRAHLLHPADQLSFSRVGFVTSSTAKIVIGHCGASPIVNFNFTYADNSTNDTISMTDLQIQPQDALTITILLESLSPSSNYTYSTSLGHVGSFSTPEENPAVLRFISTSCMKPFYPYNPLKHALSLEGFQHLSGYLSHSSTPTQDFIFFLGDFIYSDLPTAPYSYTREYFTALYRQIYASPDYTQTLRDTPWLHIFDDHEIINDYHPSMSLHITGDADPQELYKNAISPFVHYQHLANPTPYSPDVFYYTFSRGPASFFVLDTRTYRSEPARKGASMLGSEQLNALKGWIGSAKNKGKWKVVVSGVPFTQNWKGGQDAFDSWGGYLEEREEILLELWKAGGGMIISGDRHEHATVNYSPPFESGYSVIEFSTSPLSFFYQPFAREYLRENEDTDKTIHHEWEGVSKFGVFEIEESVVRFKLLVEGVEKWTYEWAMMTA
ncbi:hypothetical protein PM082_010456 [Marasmius tenuissimus]|nr:hypothetical protein PM082_010456 [Marasmius tenuissimus]